MVQIFFVEHLWYSLNAAELISLSFFECSKEKLLICKDLLQCVVVNKLKARKSRWRDNFAGWLAVSKGKDSKMKVQKNEYKKVGLLKNIPPLLFFYFKPARVLTNRSENSTQFWVNYWMYQNFIPLFERVNWYVCHDFSILENVAHVLQKRIFSLFLSWSNKL